ncbi:MAG: cysteine--tRNA ligase [Candidatus Pacebacteria bacterium]|nr:cysteine--tRNA ligase [Candidatus Paceibacterota bacterium]
MAKKKAQPAPAGKPALRLRNTLSGELEAFVPMGRAVKMYNCGPTAYDYATIGNLRAYINADTIRRSLMAWGYQVQQVINITDFGHLVSDADEGEDKMTKGLRREKKKITMENMAKLAEKYAEAFLDDIGQLGLDVEHIRFPRASHYIAEQIALVKSLEQKGYAYRLDDGVYYDTSRFAGYGKLGHQDLAGQEAGARLEVNTKKRHPADFVLWKSDKKLGWESPWGLGFPGWHTECVAMIFTLLGKQIDIHTGGIDHIAIHHNNELAQAEAATGKQFARYWMHGEFITIEDKKISKSLRNTISLRNLADKGIAPQALRYWFLTGHYRTPMNFTWDAIEGANTAYTRLARAFLELPPSNLKPDPQFIKEFYAAIAEDLNTPQAVALVWELLRNPDIAPAVKRVSLAEADRILGLGLGESGPVARVTVISVGDLPNDVQRLVSAREEARINKDYKKSDDLRAQIAKKGFDVKDAPDGQKVTKK